MVVPETVIAKAPTVRADPLAIFSVAQAAAPPIVTVNPPSMKTISPATGPVAGTPTCPGTPPDVVDHVAEAAHGPVATE